MDRINWQIIQESFLTLKKKLYAGSQYLERYGEPRTIDDLKDHHLIMSSHLKSYPIDDTERVLKRDKDINEKLDPAFLSNTFECLIEAAQKGKGIIALYEKMKIIQQEKFQNILPDLSISTHQEYFVYPKYLKDDRDIIDLKDYLIRCIKKH